MEAMKTLQQHISRETHPVTAPIMTRSLANRTQRPLSKASDDGTVSEMRCASSWVDPATGLECIMLRDNPRGFLSGYVGVNEGHPLFGWDHRALAVDLGIEVHGGLTYSQICDDGPSPEPRLIRELRRICHVVVGEVPLRHATAHRADEGQWWFGFDCDHMYDVVPGDVHDRRSSAKAGIGAEYRDDEYVVREIRNLAAQLAAIRDGRPVPPRDGPPLPPVGLKPSVG